MPISLFDPMNPGRAFFDVADPHLVEVAGNPIKVYIVHARGIPSGKLDELRAVIERQSRAGRPYAVAQIVPDPDDRRIFLARMLPEELRGDHDSIVVLLGIHDRYGFCHPRCAPAFRYNIEQFHELMPKFQQTVDDAISSWSRVAGIAIGHR